MEKYYSIYGVPYTGPHPAERKQRPSRRHTIHAVQPYKPKTLAPGDIVRFKNSDLDWRIEEADSRTISLLRKDKIGVYRRSLSRDEEHRLQIVAQPPRHSRRHR